MNINDPELVAKDEKYFVSYRKFEKKKKLNEIDFLRLLKDDSVRSTFFKPAVSCFAINETSDKLKILLLFLFFFYYYFFLIQTADKVSFVNLRRQNNNRR